MIVRSVCLVDKHLPHLWVDAEPLGGINADRFEIVVEGEPCPSSLGRYLLDTDHTQKAPLLATFIMDVHHWLEMPSSADP